MSRVYRVPYTGTLTNSGGDADLIALTPADDKPIRLKGWIIGQSSEFGDSNEEALRVTLRHMTATVTVTGGTSVTPVANRPGTTDVAAAGFTATANSSTVATTSGSSTIMEELAWNLRATPWERYIPEEDRPMAVQGEYLLVRCESTVADDVTIEVTFFVEECP
jgi:hypothetical protein